MDTIKPYLRRYVDDYLDEAIPELPAFMITGPRASGKSTTALRRAATALRLDQPRQAALMRDQLDDLLDRSELPVLIDEWQEVPESLGAVKRAVDAGAPPGSYLITGSVRARLMPTETWPGTGRFIPVKMYGLTQGEIRGSTRAATFIDRAFAGSPDLTSSLEPHSTLDYLEMAESGGFPEAVRRAPRLRRGWFEGYVEQLIGRDVEDLAAVRSPQQMLGVLRTAALNTAGLPTKQTLAQAVGADHRTAGRYLDLLVELGIVERLPAWSSNKHKRLIKTPKIHLTDTGLTMWLAGMEADGALNDPSFKGRILDSFVAAQLRPLLTISDSQPTAYHLRDDNGRWEIDLLLESWKGDLVGIEVKSSRDVLKKEVRHLERLRDDMEGRFRTGIAFHTGTAAYEVSERIYALPISAIWD